MTRRVLKDSGIDYVEVPNEAAFYGPKIDVQVWSVIGREFTLATNQVDFAQPRRFDLRYNDRDNVILIKVVDTVVIQNSKGAVPRFAVGSSRN